MVSKAFGVGCVVEGDEEGVVADAEVAVETGEESVGEMGGFPGVEGGAESLSQGMEAGLSQEGEGHASVADVEVEGSGAFPAEGLIGVEEFFDVPALGVMDGEVLDLVAGGGGEEGLEAVVVASLSAALDDLVERGVAVLEAEGSRGGGEPGPSSGEGVGIEVGELLGGGGSFGEGNHQVEGGLGEDVLEEVDGDVFGVGEDEGRAAGGVEDPLGQVEQFGSGLGDGACRGADGESQGLGGLDVETEEGLSGFEGLGLVLVLSPDHLALGIAAQPVGVDGQQISLEVSAGASDLTEGDLELLGLGDGVGVEQVVDGLVGGDEGESVGEFEPFLGEGAGLADAGHAQGGLVNELQSQAGFDAAVGLSAPAADQVPGSETEVFGNEQPDPQEGSRNLVGQQLPDAPFEAVGVARFVAATGFGALGLDGGWRNGFRTRGV